MRIEISCVLHFHDTIIYPVENRKGDVTLTKIILPYLLKNMREVVCCKWGSFKHTISQYIYSTKRIVIKAQHEHILHCFLTINLARLREDFFCGEGLRYDNISVVYFSCNKVFLGNKPWLCTCISSQLFNRITMNNIVKIFIILHPKNTSSYFQYYLISHFILIIK